MIVLYGAGAAGRYCLKYLLAKEITPACFVDNDANKIGTVIEGIRVLPEERAFREFAEKEWVVAAISRPAAPEIRARVRALEVKEKSLWECLDVQHGLPPQGISAELCRLSADPHSVRMLRDQTRFRGNPDYDAQESPDDCKDIYFPNFILRLDDEHFVDCGAADGDSIAAFKKRWTVFEQITAFEPDQENLKKLREVTWDDSRILRFNHAVSDHQHETSFAANGDYSSHLGRGESRVRCWSLDDLWGKENTSKPPTYIKMDIEGSELEGLWGARRILKDHSPVLAICAYHTSDHLWQVPLLIHAIQPDYKLFFRRYAEGAFELVWYAVPPERVK